MIGYLRGEVLEHAESKILMTVGSGAGQGVGYLVTIPQSGGYASLRPREPVELYIHTHVREDALSLFGFVSAAEKALFEKLITVSGIGPKLAVTALSGLAAAELAGAIRNGSIEQLVRIPGVGKKTAERMILELRDKLDLTGLPERAGATPVKSSFDPVEEDVISALMNFGAVRAAAEGAVSKARSSTEGNDFDALFRRALKLVR